MQLIAKTLGIYKSDDRLTMAGSKRRLVLILSASLYVVACVLPAANPDGEDPVGLTLLISGIFAYNVGEYRWFANVFYVAGIVLASSRRPRRLASAICLALGAALAISCIAFPPHVIVGLGNYSVVQAPLAIGGYLWILAQVVALSLPFTPGKKSCDNESGPRPNTSRSGIN